jgi:hypothetical protein
VSHVSVFVGFPIGCLLPALEGCRPKWRLFEKRLRFVQGRWKALFGGYNMSGSITPSDSLASAGM